MCSSMLLVLCYLLLFQSESFTNTEDTYQWPSGPLTDTTCNIETVEQANSAQLSLLLNELTDSTFFRLFRVRLDMECTFWKKDSPEEETCTTTLSDSSSSSSSSSSFTDFIPNTGDNLGDSQPHSACSITPPFSQQEQPAWISVPLTDDVDRTISFQEEEVMMGSSPENLCEEENLPTFWLDMCHDIPTDSPDFVNLKLNPGTAE